MSPTEIIEAQLEAYNAQNLDAFCESYAEDVIVADLNGAITQQGRAALRERYAKTFVQFPQNKARILNRIAVGNTVVDHEDVERAPGGERFQVVVVYTIKNGRIARVDFAK